LNLITELLITGEAWDRQ